MKKKFLSLLLAVFFITTAGFGQESTDESLEGTLAKLAGTAAKSYVGPIVTGFGADLNGGWFHKAPRSTMFGIDLEFGLVAMGAFPSEESKKFSTSGAFKFSYEQAGSIADQADYSSVPVLFRQQARNDVRDQIAAASFDVGISGATIIGSKTDTIKVTFPQKIFTANGQNITVPESKIGLGVGGLLEDVSVIPLAAPQLSIGTFVGTQFTFRYLPEVEVSPEIGKFKYFGFGISHNPGIWFPNPLPVDLSASFFTQTLSVGTLFETKATAFGVNVSKRFGPGAINITPYAGFMLESSKMKFTYDYTVNGPGGTPITDKIEFELEGENKTRITLGLSLKLLFLNINADYNLGKNNSATAGLMFII